MCLGPRCYTPIKLQKMHSILKWSKRELIPKMFLYCPNNIDLVLYYNVSYVISYMLENFGHFIFIKNTQHYLWTIYYAKNRPPLSHQVQHLSNWSTYTDLSCSRGVVRGGLSSLRIVAHAKDDCRGNILVIFYYIIRLKFYIFRK